MANHQEYFFLTQMKNLNYHPSAADYETLDRRQTNYGDGHVLIAELRSDLSNF